MTSEPMQVTVLRQELMADLVRLEAELRRLGYWSSVRPSSQALASREPFACDSLSFTQWLQFIFVARITELLKNGEALPGSCGMTPMAEHFFTQQGVHVPELLDCIRQIDQRFTGE